MLNLTPVNLKVFQRLHHAAMIRGVPYSWGAKPSLSSSVSDIRGSDCSGWSRWLVYHSTGGEVVLPEGSYQQYEFLRSYLHQVEYRQVRQPLSDARLFVSFIKPTLDHAGHVWFCRGNQTWECYGACGVGCRDPFTRPLKQEVFSTLEWPHAWH